MIKSNISNLLVSIFIIILIFGFSINANSIGIEQIIKTGLINNTKVKDINHKISQLRKSIELIKKQNDWQLDMMASKNLDYKDTLKTTQDSEQIAFTSSKKILNERITINAKAAYQEDIKPKYELSFNYNIYPDLPSENMKSIIKINNQIKEQKKLLDIKKANLVKDCLDIYLEMIRLEQSIEIIKRRLNILKEESRNTIKKIQIKEANKKDILEKKILLSDMKYKLEKNELRFKSLKNSLFKRTGISSEFDIKLKREIKLISDFRRYLDNYNIKDEILINNILKSSSQYEYLNNQLRLLKDELKWLKKEDNLDINLKGNYQSNDDYQASVSMVYNIFDSGRAKLKTIKKDNEIKSLKRMILDCEQNKELKLESIIDQITLSELNLRNKKLLYQKALEELKVFNKQYKLGYINKNIYRVKLINKKSTFNQLRKAIDQLFINKLNLITLVDPSLVIDMIDF